jgi:hypothetical protein
MESLVGFFAALAIMVVLFLIFRAMVIWYFRIGETIELLKSIDEKLGRISQGRP